MPGQPPQHWLLRDVVPLKSYTIEFPLDRATMYFKWSFAALADGCSRLSQHVALMGENAATYVPIVQETFALSLQPGMEKIAASMGAAYARAKL
jgi:hypothetical protein